MMMNGPKTGGKEFVRLQLSTTTPTIAHDCLPGRASGCKLKLLVSKRDKVLKG